MSKDFVTGLSLIEGYFDGQVTSFQLIATFSGVVIMLCGLTIVGLITFYRLKGQRVMLEVIGLHEDSKQIDKDDDEHDVADKLANPTIRLEYRVQDGPNVGAEAMASSAGNKVEHGLGDVVPGYFFPSSKDVLSRAQTISGYKFGLSMAGIGLAFTLLVNTMVAQW